MSQTRDVVRKTDYDAQKVEYTGKHKSHTAKNLLVTEKSTYIKFVSPTFEGAMHDKAILDETPLTGIPENSTIVQDLGFLGHKPVGIQIMMPEKKPKGKELTPEQKESNRQISKVRVLVEHAIAGVKRLKIIKDKIRLKIEGIRDTVMYVACALHNLRIKTRKPNFSS
ncbi:MAG: IS5 family transposase [Thermoflexibacter sp.]